MIRALRMQASIWGRQAWDILGGSVGVLRDELRAHVRLDLPLAIICAVYFAAWLPIVGRAADDPVRLRCCVLDEPPLSMALDGMRALPYGDPFNFVLAPARKEPLPRYYGALNYAGVGYYYGGVYMGLAFLAYGPLQALGLPPFPTAPIVLRVLSTLSGLLALIVTYNFARRHVGRVGALIAGLLLLFDGYFIYYAVVVHPDMTQLALALLVLVVACRHVEGGSLESLAAVGILAGMVQGTKMGGPWLMPLAGLVLVLGVYRSTGTLWSASALRRLAKRGAALFLLALAVYFVTTPYAFIRPDFYRMTKVVLGLMGNSWIVPTNFTSWISSLWSHFGKWVLIPVLIDAALVLMLSLRRPCWPLLLAITLGLSQVLWYGLNGRLWVELGYMLGAFAVIGLLAGDFVERLASLLRRIPVFGKPAKYAVAGAAALVVFAPGWWTFVNIALSYRLTDEQTQFQIDRWAEEGNITHSARILADDVAYFDPQQFPNAYQRGDLLTYDELYRFRPDYIVISSSMYDAPHFAAARKTQHFSMQQAGPFSVRLYQDLLDNKPPAARGIEFVRRFAPSLNRHEECTASRSPSNGDPVVSVLGEVATRIRDTLGSGGLGGWLSTKIADQTSPIELSLVMVDALRGHRCVSFGPTLLLYRVEPPGSANGISQPIASSSWKLLSPVDGFDGDPASRWMPAIDDTADAPWLGFDYGGGAERTISHIHIEWLNKKLAAPRIAVDFEDAPGGAWHPAAVFDLAQPDATSLAAGSPVAERDIPPAGAHRLWRVRFLDLPQKWRVGVRQLRLSDHGP